MKKEVEKEKYNIKNFFSILFLILSLAIGVMSILVAIADFSLGLVPSGIIYLILGIFTFLPRKIIRIPNWGKFLIALIIFVILLIISGATWQVPDTPNNIISHDIKETFILDGGASNISMMIYNTSKEESILMGGKEKTTEGYFFFVNSRITNLGISAVSMNPTYDIIDSQNKSYAGIEFSGYQEAFQPDLMKQVYFLFELPISAQELKFRIQDKVGIHVIDLGI